MAWSQSHFLQSIGWATINSLWQMAILWCLYIGVNHFFKLSSSRKYQLAVGMLFSGFSWALLYFFLYFINPHPVSSGLINAGLPGSPDFITNVLFAAALTYLGLLIIPGYRLFKNWQFVKQIQNTGIHKAALQYRLFIQKTSFSLGIGKKVVLYVSDLITSPVTIGFLKPVILLPVAVLNNLSVQQVEAILLHELSHIKRYDYLVNLITSMIGTMLYFNPFVKLFTNVIDEERENCCDELVLQFDYDTASYASALLTLEQLSSSQQGLTMAATGKNPLLKRIEKMAGMENKNHLSFRQLAGLLTALLFILAFNSLLIVKSVQKEDQSIALKSMANPFLFMPGDEDQDLPAEQKLPVYSHPTTNIASAFRGQPGMQFFPEQTEFYSFAPAVVDENYMQAGADEVESSLSIEQKEQVRTTVKATKKVMKDLQWKEIENQIAEVMTPQEKAMAKKEYNVEVEKINWNHVEANLKAQYENLDWQRINYQLSQALTTIQLDSIQNSFVNILNQLEATEKEMMRSRHNASPIPDASVSEVKRMKEEVMERLDKIKTARNRKIIRL